MRIEAILPFRAALLAASLLGSFLLLSAGCGDEVTVAPLPPPGGEEPPPGEDPPPPPPDVPSFPLGVSATPYHWQTTISWGAVSGATGYNVYWSETPGLTAATGNKIGGATSPRVHTELTPGITYYYVVTAENAVGEGPASGQAGATPTLLSVWAHMSAGANTAFGIGGDGALWAWGSGHAFPVAMEPGATWSSVAAGTSGGMVAIRSDGTLWAWMGFDAPMERVGADADWATVARGGSHSAALKTNGTLWAWGANSAGQLGDGTTTDRSSPVRIGTASDWLAVTAGFNHTLGRKTSGLLYSWGSNLSGQLGYFAFDVCFSGISFPCEKSPVPLSVATDWQEVSAGVEYSAALKSGALLTWGRNEFGQLGDGTTTNRQGPQGIGGGPWSTVSAWATHTLALRSDGTLWAWGQNSYGQLGTADTVSSSIPVQVLGIDGVGYDADWVAISTGSGYSLARKADGTLWAWGYNADGRLGDGTTTSRLTPVQVGFKGAPPVPPVPPLPADPPLSMLSFADPSLDACVKSRPVTYVSQLKTLQCISDGITHIGGIEVLTSLQSLWLNGNNISDVSLLASLTTLTELNLYGNPITNLSPLASLGGLTTLYVGNDLLTDLSPLSSLTSLATLGLFGSALSDVGPLASLTGLVSLDLYWNTISDVGPLASLTGLTELNLTGNAINDLSPLASTTALTSLGLDNNAITDLSPLASLTALTSLSFSSNNVAGVNALGALPDLTLLDASDNSITDVGPLAPMTNLLYLYLNNNVIADVGPLASLTNLDLLYLKNNVVTMGVADLVTLTGAAHIFLLDNAGLPCADVALLDIALDGGNGAASGIVTWNTCL